MVAPAHPTRSGRRGSRSVLEPVVAMVDIHDLAAFVAAELTCTGLVAAFDLVFRFLTDLLGIPEYRAAVRRWPNEST